MEDRREGGRCCTHGLTLRAGKAKQMHSIAPLLGNAGHFWPEGGGLGGRRGFLPNFFLLPGCFLKRPRTLYLSTYCSEGFLPLNIKLLQLKSLILLNLVNALSSPRKSPLKADHLETFRRALLIFTLYTAGSPSLRWFNIALRNF